MMIFSPHYRPEFSISLKANRAIRFVQFCLGEIRATNSMAANLIENEWYNGTDPAVITPIPQTRSALQLSFQLNICPLTRNCPLPPFLIAVPYSSILVPSPITVLCHSILVPITVPCFSVLVRSPITVPYYLIRIPTPITVLLLLNTCLLWNNCPNHSFPSLVTSSTSYVSLLL